MAERTNQRGRPATGQRPIIHARIPVDLLFRVDDFAAVNFIGRSEAVATLIEKGLADGARKE